MTKSAIKICNFFHYFLKEGGYPDCDQFSLLLFSLFMRGGRVLREIVPNSLYPLFIFFEGFPYPVSRHQQSPGESLEFMSGVIVSEKTSQNFVIFE